MDPQLLNQLRNAAGFGHGVAMNLYDHDATEMWVEYDQQGEECWPSREIMEKFAELIVWECVQAIQDGTPQGDHYAQRVEEHFNPTAGGILHYGD